MVRPQCLLLLFPFYHTLKAFIHYTIIITSCPSDCSFRWLHMACFGIGSTFGQTQTGADIMSIDIISHSYLQMYDYGINFLIRML